MLNRAIVLSIGGLCLPLSGWACTSEDDAAGAPEVSILLPAAHTVVSGRIDIVGTSQNAELVHVKIGDTPFMEATGTDDWSLSLDTATIADGGVVVKAKATNADFEVAVHSIGIEVANVDPVVGIWLIQSVSGEVPECAGYGYTVRFYESGTYDETACPIFCNEATAWQREEPNVISISRVYGAVLPVTTTFSDDDALALSWTTSTGKASAQLDRQQ